MIFINSGVDWNFTKLDTEIAGGCYSESGYEIYIIIAIMLFSLKMCNMN